MSKASYWQRGETLDYKNTGSSTIEANTVVELTGRVGIAGTDIAPGAEGDLHVCGVFEFDKTGTNEIAFGQPVYFDKTGITDAANNGETSGNKVAYTPAGFAAKAAAAGDAKVLVKIG
jgi:predicted RecA/RadA family phage recombinase